MLKHISLPVLFLSLGIAQTEVPPFQIGEKLTFSAQFNFIPAGQASLQVLEADTIDSNPVYHVVFTAWTGKIADRIFKIRDQVHTWIDQENYSTYQQKKKIREGGYKQTTLTKVDYKKSIAVTGKDTFQVTKPLRDTYSLFYYLRTIPLTVGDVMAFSAFDNNHETSFQLEISNREEISVPAGTFSCLKVNPFRNQQSLFKNQGDMIIWFSDDEHHLPVQIQIRMKYGSMLLRLESVTLWSPTGKSRGTF